MRTSFYIRHAVGLVLIVVAIAWSGPSGAVRGVMFAVGIALILWGVIAAVRGGDLGDSDSPGDFTGGAGGVGGGI